MKKKRILMAIIGLILIVGVSFGAIHQKKVEAERIVQEEQDAKLEKEKKDLEKAKVAVDEAYKTRKEEDIILAETAISKLNDNQKEDKASLTDKLTKLMALLNQLDVVNEQVSKTEKSKSQADIDASQKLIDKLTDDYLKKDKELAQKTLDEIKIKLSKEQEQAEKAKKEASLAQEINKLPTQAEAVEPVQPQYQEQPEATYTPPVNNETSTPLYPLPATGGGSSNGSGETSNGGSQGGGGNVPTPNSPTGGHGTQGTNNIHGWEIETEW